LGDIGFENDEQDNIWLDIINDRLISLLLPAIENTGNLIE